MSWTGIVIVQVSSVMIMEAGTEDRKNRKMRRKRGSHSSSFKAKVAVTAVRDGFRDPRVGVARRSPAGG